MGENEQGGMLRTVVVLGLIAIIGIAIVFSVIGLKSNMAKNTTDAVGVVVRTPTPHGIDNPNVKYSHYTPNPSTNSGYGDHPLYMPIIGNVPPGYWREYVITMKPSEDVSVNFDVNTNKKVPEEIRDYDDINKRSLKIYKGNVLIASRTGTQLMNSVNIKANTEYTMVVKYYNSSNFVFVDQHYKYEWANLSALHSTTFDGRRYDLNITDLESATFENEYNVD